MTIGYTPMHEWAIVGSEEDAEGLQRIAQGERGCSHFTEEEIRENILICKILSSLF